MTKCTGAGTIYSDVNFCPGSKSLPGVRGWVYGISKKDIVKWPTIGGEAPKSLADVAKYTGDFTPASDKKWHKVALIPNESQLQVEAQGAYGSKTFKVTGTAVAQSWLCRKTSARLLPIPTRQLSRLSATTNILLRSIRARLRPPTATSLALPASLSKRLLKAFLHILNRFFIFLGRSHERSCDCPFLV